MSHIQTQAIRVGSGITGLLAENQSAGMTVDTTCMSGCKSSVERTGGIVTQMILYRHAQLYVDNSTSRLVYLEVTPTIVWVMDDGGTNEVLSNTTWNVD